MKKFSFSNIFKKEGFAKPEHARKKSLKKPIIILSATAVLLAATITVAAFSTGKIKSAEANGGALGNDISQLATSTEQTSSEQISSEQTSSEQISSEQISSEQTSSEQISSEYPSSKEPISSEASSKATAIAAAAKPKPVSSEKPKPVSSEKPKPVSSEKPKPVSSEKPKPVSSEAPPPVVQTNGGEMKAVWISFLEFLEFKGSSEQAFTNKMNTYFDDCVSKGLNTVIVQVRPHGDSFYESDYYPWSKCISGTMGTSVSYDPLKIMVDAAHSKGLSIHAWINPYRTMTDSEMSTVSDHYPVKQWYNADNRGDYMVKMSDGRWWLKPGNTEAQQLIINGATEIVSKYNVDGLHLDDYFYGGAISLYGDTTAQAKANTTALIKGLHDGIKAIRSSVMFGVSPSGAYRENNSLPSSDLTYLSTDLKKWCQNPGYIDYVMPQIYWWYGHKTQPFTMTLNKWEDFVTEPSVALYIGLAASQPEISDDEFTQQILDVGSSNRATGYCLYRYAFIGGRNIP